MKPSLMYQELRQTGDVCQRILQDNVKIITELAAIFQKREPPLIITCARGSSDMAASFAKTIFESRLGTIVASYAPSMSSVYETRFRNLENAVFIVISQSGKSPDIISSLVAANEAGALTIAIVNDESSPAASLADFVLPMRAGPEKSVAATKTFIASLFVVCDLLAAWQNDIALRNALEDAPNAFELAPKLEWGEALPCFRDAKTMFVLGRSLTFGIAGEAALKLKETSSLHAEAFSAAEVKHGPMALVKAGFPVLLFPPKDSAEQYFGSLIKEFSDRGAKCFCVGGKNEGGYFLPAVENLHPLIDPMAKILSFYAFAEELSRARGFDPDKPPFLQKVTATK